MTKFVTFFVLALALLASVSHVHAQQAGKVYRVGYMAPGPVFPAFRQRLRELGYIEGKNLTIEYRRGKNIKQFPKLAAELVRVKVDCILTVGISATRAAKKATRSIPIIMGNSSADPVRHGLIASLSRPGGNVTGVFDLLPDLAGKRLELLKEIFPKLSRVGHLSVQGSPVSSDHLKATEAAARAMGVQIKPFLVKSPNDFESAFRAAAEGGAQAAIVVGVSFFIPNRKRVIRLSAKYRLPTIYTHRRWVPAGGFISYTTDAFVRYRRAAELVDKILKGAKPADFPVEQPKKFVLEVNLKTAKALGVTIPPDVIFRATKVIR